MSDSAKPSPVELPCGADCQFSVPLENGSWEDWAWCTHPAGGGLIRHRRDCRWFRTRSEKVPLRDLSASDSLARE